MTRAGTAVMEKAGAGAGALLHPRAYRQRFWLSAVVFTGGGDRTLTCLKSISGIYYASHRWLLGRQKYDAAAGTGS